MNFSRPHQHIRHIVWATLLVWLFALGAGVANACVLSAPEADLAPVVVANPLAAEHADHGLDVGQSGCLKFCDDSTETLPAAKVANPDPGAPAVGLIPLWRHAASAPAVLLPRSYGRPLSFGPPLVIRLQRLAL